MNDKELNSIIDRSEDEYQKLKDKVIEQGLENERLNNIIKELEKLELYEFTPDYDYDENLVEGYTPFNIREYIQELKGSDDNG